MTRPIQPRSKLKPIEDYPEKIPPHMVYGWEVSAGERLLEKRGSGWEAHCIIHKDYLAVAVSPQWWGISVMDVIASIEEGISLFDWVCNERR